MWGWFQENHVLFCYDTVLYNNSRMLHSIVKKMADLSTGFEVLTTLQPFAGNQVMELVDLD